MNIQVEISETLKYELVKHASMRVGMQHSTLKATFTNPAIVTAINPNDAPEKIRYNVTWIDANDSQRKLSVECIYAHPMGCLDMGIYFTDRENLIYRKSL